jgi:hypothetical protein
MSTLVACEEGLLATCRGYEVDGDPLFTEANSSRDDWSVIDSPSSDWALVVTMGGETLEGDRIDGYGAHGEYQERHQLLIAVTVRVATGETAVAEQTRQLKAHVEAIKDLLRANRHLGLDFVRDAIPVRTSTVLERVPRREAPSHLLQQVTVYVYASTPLDDED